MRSPSLPPSSPSRVLPRGYCSPSCPPCTPLVATTSYSMLHGGIKVPAPCTFRNRAPASLLVGGAFRVACPLDADLHPGQVGIRPGNQAVNEIGTVGLAGTKASGVPRPWLTLFAEPCPAESQVQPSRPRPTKSQLFVPSFST